MDTAAIELRPVVFVHGFGGSFRTTWQEPGITELVLETGRPVIGVDLLGHGEAPAPRDPAAYADLTERVVLAIDGYPRVDAVGFSLGALTLLRTAVHRPERFGRLVLAGIGRNVFERDEAAHRRILAAVQAVVDGDDPGDDQLGRLFAGYARRAGNDPAALAALLRAPSSPVTGDELARVAGEVLVCIGDDDFVGPADQLVDALPNASLVELRRTDHFATPESFAFVDAMLDFLT